MATTPTVLSTGTKVAAWGITIVYFVVAAVLLWRFGLGDGAGGNWERALVVFNSLSAIAFAAVGALLGTTVQQVNVAKAQKEAADARASENRMAEHSAELSEAAAEQLAKTSGVDEPSIRAEKFGNAGETRLRQAIMKMDKALRERAAE